MASKVNHRCIICGEGYYHCNDCGNMKSFTPWRSIACSAECYQTYLAFLDYRDNTKDAKAFAKQVDQIGMNIRKLPPALLKVYRSGRTVAKRPPVTEKPVIEVENHPEEKTKEENHVAEEIAPLAHMEATPS